MMVVMMMIIIIIIITSAIVCYSTIMIEMASYRAAPNWYYQCSGGYGIMIYEVSFVKNLP